MKKLYYDLEKIMEWDDNKVYKFFDEHYEIVSQILDNKEYNYYYWVGSYPNIKSEDLAKAEKIQQQYMVSGLMKNPNVSGAWLSRKLKSTDLSIAQNAAAHKNLPLKEFNKLPKMKNKLMVKAMLSNPNCPAEYLEEYFYADEEENVFTKEKANLATVMNNPNLPFKLFEFAIENHNDYYKYIDDMLSRINITEKHTKALDKKYPKKSTYFDRMLLKLAENKGCKDNIDLQSFLATKIYQEFDNNYKKLIMKAIGQYLLIDDIIKVYRKLTPDHLTELLRNPNTPEEFVVNIILKAKIIHIGEMYDGYLFTDDELVRIVLESDNARTSPGRPTRGERFFDKYKEKFSSSVLTEIFEKTKYEKFLPPEARDMFLF